MTDTQKLIAIARLAADMRLAQKAYFKGRTPEALEQSKRLERAVDKATDEVLLFTTPTLFDLEPAEATHGS